MKRDISKDSSTEVCSLLSHSYSPIFPTMSIDNSLSRVNNLPFGCTQCHLTFALEGHLRRHEIECHTPADQYKCRHCEYSTNRREQLASHRKRHLNNEWVCPYCSAHPKNHRFLERHIAQYHCDLAGAAERRHKLVFTRTLRRRKDKAEGRLWTFAPTHKAIRGTRAGRISKTNTQKPKDREARSFTLGRRRTTPLSRSSSFVSPQTQAQKERSRAANNATRMRRSSSFGISRIQTATAQSRRASLAISICSQFNVLNGTPTDMIDFISSQCSPNEDQGHRPNATAEHGLQRAHQRLTCTASALQELCPRSQSSLDVARASSQHP